MKKTFTILTAALMLLAMFANPMKSWADTYSLTPDQSSTGLSNTSYVTTLTEFSYNSISWKMNQWNPSTLQVKTNQSSAASEFRFYNTSAIPGRITQVVITFDALTVTDASKLMFLGGTSEVTATTGGTAGTWNATAKTLTWTPGSSDDFTYFAFYQNGKAASGTNYLASANAIVVTYGGGGTPTPTMSVSTNAIAFGDNPINPSSPYTETFDVTFSDLTQNLTVAGFSGISVNPTTINYNGTSPQTVTVTYNPTAVGSISGNITVSNTDDGLSETIAVTGSAYDPSNVDTYEKYTGSIVEGDYVIYANNYALKNTLNNGPRFNNESVTPTDNTITNPDASIIWHIAPDGNYWTIYNADINKYAGGTSSKNQGALLETVTDLARWEIYFQTGILYIANYGRSQGSDPNNKFIRQNGTSGWATYAQGTGAAPQLYKKVVANQVAIPTFSPAGGTYYAAQNVTLSCATSGATIYYTTDGSTPTTSSTAYSTAIPVSATTTIKAIAVKAGMTDSDVATATYTIELPLSTMDQIFARATEIGNTATAVRIAINNWVVSAANSSSHTFVTDGTKGFMIYASNHGFAAGDILSGTVECNLQLYNGAAEVTGLTSTTTGLTVTTGGTVTVANIAMADLSGINTGALVSYNDLACSEETSGSYTNYYLTDGTTTIQAYHTIIGSLSGLLEDGKTYNLTGVYCQNNSTKRINPRGATDIEEVVPTPVSYYYSINGTLSAEQTCAVGSTKTLETGTDLYSNFTFAGWTTNANDVSQRLTEYTFSDDTPVIFYAVYAHPTTTTASSKNGESYVKVNSISEGDYLIVYEGSDNEVNDIPYIFNGLSSANGYVTSVYSNTNEIASVPAGAAIVTISAYDTGYSIQISSNSTNNPSKYIGGTSGSNTMNFSDSPILNNISIDNEGDADIISNTSHLRWNLAQEMFRYYKSASYDQQSAIQLYKKSGSSPVVVTNYYTRVFNETATADIDIIGPSIIPSFGLLDMDTYEIDFVGATTCLIIEEGGQLIYSGEEVRVEYQKNITAPSGTWGQNDNTGWYAISSPTGRYSKTSEINDFEYIVAGARRFDFFAYGEKCGWYNKTDAENYVSEVKAGYGYLYAREVGTMVVFHDDACRDDYNLTNLSYTSSRGNLAGLHCIGNPYTHNIYKGVGITGDMTTGYYALNEATGAWISTTDATAIVPTQAILVFVNKTDGTAAIHMTSDNSAPSSKANNDYIKFNVANSKYEDVAYAWFDNGEGLKKINHRNSEVPMLYIPRNNANYSIAYMSDNTDMFNLNFKAMTTGKYTLSVSEKGDFSYLHIYDRLTGEDVDMLNDDYSFIGAPSDNEARFIVRLSYSAGNGSDINTFAFQNGSDIIVNGEGELQIFDVMGRMVKNTVINGVETIAMPQGVYIFRLNENIQKIVVR